MAEHEVQKYKHKNDTKLDYFEPARRAHDTEWPKVAPTIGVFPRDVLMTVYYNAPTNHYLPQAAIEEVENVLRRYGITGFFISTTKRTGV